MKDLGHDMASINPAHADTDYAARLEPLTRTLLTLGGGSLMGGCVALRKSQESRARLAADMGIPQEASGAMPPEPYCTLTTPQQPPSFMLPP